MRGQDAGRIQTLEFTSPVGPWRLWIWTPAPDLQAAVACLWATEVRTVAFRERIVPRETVELMVNFGGSQTLHRTGTGREPVQFRRTWVSGLQTACLEIESPTAAQLIAASLRPAHAGPLLGVASNELANRVVPLEDVVSRQAEMLAGRLEETSSIEGRFLLFEDFLRERIRRSSRAPHPTAVRAVSRLVESGGTLQAQKDGLVKGFNICVTNSIAAPPQRV